MNKKLIAMAISAIVAAPAAMANDTTIYGKLHMDVAYNQNVGGSNYDNYTVDSNASRLGFKGTEDLGDGLKAIWQIEFGVNMDNNSGTMSGRNTFLGLTGDFGTVLAGKHDTPAKVAFYSVGNDIIGDSIVDLNRVAGGGKVGGGSGVDITHWAYGLPPKYVSSGGFLAETFTEIRANNAIAYVSPSFSGFTAAGAVVAGEGKKGTSNGLADAYSLSAMYHGYGLKAAVSYEVLKKDYISSLGLLYHVFTGPLTTNNYYEPYKAENDHKMWQAEASYTLGDFMVGANYESDKNYLGLDGASRHAWAVVGKYTMGNNYVMANYGKTKGDALASEMLNNADGFGIGVGHKFSKRTQVYLAYHETKYKASGYEGDSQPSQNPSSIALGMIHTF